MGGTIRIRGCVRGKNWDSLSHTEDQEFEKKVLTESRSLTTWDPPPGRKKNLKSFR